MELELEVVLLLGGGSVVTKNIPPMAVAVGNPAKITKYRDENIEKNS